MNVLVRAKLRVKIKSLAEEARIIRREAEGRPGPVVERLQTHRRVVVRAEARATQLAYALLRGRSYREVEPTGRKPVDLHRVAAICKSLGSEIYDPDRKDWPISYTADLPNAERVQTWISKELVRTA